MRFMKFLFLFLFFCINSILLSETIDKQELLRGRLLESELTSHKKLPAQISLHKSLLAIMPIIQKHMRQRAVPGIQITLFKATNNKFVHSSYGYADIQKKRSVGQQTLFQSGTMARWFMAYVFLKQLEKQKYKLSKVLSDPQFITTRTKPFSLKYATALKNKNTTLHNLLTMTSGLPRWYLPSKPTPFPHTAWEINTEPDTLIQLAPQGYVYLARMLGEKASQKNSSPFINLLESEMKKSGMQNSCIKQEHCRNSKQASMPMATIRHVKSAKRYKKPTKKEIEVLAPSFFALPEWRSQYPAATMLYTNSADYARFLTQLWQQAKQNTSSFSAQMLRPQYQYETRLGGMGYGSFFSKPVFWTKSINN